MNEQTRNEIIHRWQDGQSMRSIARMLDVSRYAVKRTIEEVQQARESQEPTVARSPKSPLLDPYDESIRRLLERYPRITATRMLEELRREGYQGSYTILRQRLKQLRVQPSKKPVVRFETQPGRQAQMDWAVYTIDFTSEGRRRVNLFSYVLGYSRRQYLRFTDSQDFESTIREHVRAFEHLGGVAAECLYDNMKVVVDRIEDDEPVYNARFLSFATHYGFRPRAFVRRGDNLVFVGQSGLGKSHLIQAIGRSCCVHGYRVRYRTSAELLSKLGQSLADGTTPKLIRQYARYDLLIIDEFGFDKLEREDFPQASSLLYKVIDSRTRERSTALVTNIDFDSWGDYLGDPPMAMAFLDRVVDGAIILKFRGKSYRAHRAQKPSGGK